MESNTPRTTITGNHCGKCIYFRELGRCGNPREANRLRSYFEVACHEYKEATPIALASLKAECHRVPSGYMRCRHCGAILPMEQMARGPWGFILVCKPCKKELASAAGKSTLKSKLKNQRP